PSAAGRRAQLAFDHDCAVLQHADHCSLAEAFSARRGAGLVRATTRPAAALWPLLADTGRALVYRVHAPSVRLFPRSLALLLGSLGVARGLPAQRQRGAGAARAPRCRRGLAATPASAGTGPRAGA